MVLNKKNQGFSIVELLMILVALAILGTLGFAQYTKILERSRASEARVILRRIRDAEEMHLVENVNFLNVEKLIESELIGDMPTDSCRSTHYFRYGSWVVLYDLEGQVSYYSLMATRCDGSDENNKGKSPDTDEGYVIFLNVNRRNNTVSWLEQKI